MTMNLHDAVNGDGLFDVQGKIFKAVGDLDTAAGSTVPTAFNGFNTQYQNLSSAVLAKDQNLNNPVAAPIPSWQRGGSSLISWARTRASQILAAFVNADAPQAAQGDDNNLAYLLAQMKSGSYYLTPSVATTSLAAAAGNGSTDLAILHTPNREDGRNQQHALGEAVAISILGTGSTPSLRFVSSAAAADKLDQDWPLASATNFSLTATTPSNSVAPNGDFEDAATADIPDGWLVAVGSPGTTVKLSIVAVQTITISGTPTGGWYVLEWTAPSGVTYATTLLPFNASGSQVQTALRSIPDFSLVTVSTSGTNPNLTHTVTLTGVAGDVNTLAYINQLSPGSIATATTTHGDAAAYKGQALIFASNGSELTAIYSPALSLSPGTVYFVAFRSRRVGATAGGQIAAEIVGSIGGSVLDDDAGNANQLLISATSIATASTDLQWFSFRLPASQTGPVYLRLRISSAIDNGVSIYWDEVAIVAGQELYAGGPFVAAVAGITPPLATDAWTLTVANDRAGVLHEWYNRSFDLAGKRILLPATGSTLIPNSVVS